MIINTMRFIVQISRNILIATLDCLIIELDLSNRFIASVFLMFWNVCTTKMEAILLHVT